MQNQNKKIIRWVLGGGILCLFIVVLETFIADLISKNNSEVFRFYLTIMILITMFIYLIISVIKIVQYQRYVKKYKSEELEKANKELTSEFKEVLLNYSEPISKECFECQAKVDDDGKIVCKIQLDYEVKIESYEKFLRYFHFTQH